MHNAGDDWLEAHVFYTGACDAVRELLAAGEAQNVYIITTKAAEFTKKLLQQERLFGNDAVSGGIIADNIYGLGSGPKQDVLASLLAERGPDAKAVFVEDRLLTLQKTMEVDALRQQVIPVLASWGYNTPSQREVARAQGITVLGEDPSSLSSVLSEASLQMQVTEADTKL